MTTRNAGLKSDWEAAHFLASCGYLVPFSSGGCQEWLRFSGKSGSEPIWEIWVDTLKTESTDPVKLCELDLILNAFFFPIHGSWLFHSGNSADFCCLCPLNKECRYFSNLNNYNEKDLIENLIRIGDTADIHSRSLIPFLAGNRYTGTDIQKSVIQELNSAKSQIDDMAVTDSDDEQFLLFINALLLFSEKFSVDKPSLSGTVFNKSELIYREIGPELQSLKQEAFYTLILDNRYRKIHFKQITKGTLNRSLIHPREVFAPAIQLRSAAVILVHNHPSGDPQPSTQDIEITKRLVEAGNIVGINVVDHVIIGNNCYFSFVDESMI